MKNNIAIGDKLKRKKALVIEHVGVYLGGNSVLTNAPGKGEHTTTIEEFSEGQPITVESTGAHWATVLNNAWRILSRPKRYNLFSRNCEHTTSEVLFGKPESGSMLAIGIIAGLGLLLVASRSR
jgi:hypothetical protein